MAVVLAGGLAASAFGRAASPPEVQISGDAALAEGGGFSGTGSFVDRDSKSWTATVDYGDGSGVQTLALTANNTFELQHVYADDGTFKVTVTVTDEQGESGSGSHAVAVANVAPVVSAGPDATVELGQPFSGAGSFADPGADAWSATVDYGDGSGPQALALQGKAFSLSRTYAQEGTFTVTVTVADDDGGSGSDSLSITVSRPEPTPGVEVVAESVAGRVLARLPGQADFVELTRLTDLPVGTEVDATGGTVRITHALPDGTTESGSFEGGRFVIGQRLEEGGITELALSGEGFSACGTRVLNGPAAPGAAPRLLATVAPGGGINLTTAASRRVRRLDAGTYRIVVRDRSPRHSFHLVGRGVDRATGTRFRGRKTWLIRLHGGRSYRFFSDAGARRRSGSFRVVSRTVRKLWGNADGSFRTKGRYASATVRGTVWLTADRCEGTDVRVRAGSVTVRDSVRELDVVVRAGQRYLAQPGAEGAGLRCTIVGTPGPDVLRGTSRRDVLCGLGGHDVLLGLAGSDVLLGGEGNDRLAGGGGPDRLFGGFGNDRLLGGTGNDLLDDAEGRDVFRGGPGSDRCRRGGRVTACP